VPKPDKRDFSLKLTRVIEPKGGPGVELATLEDAAQFMGEDAAVSAAVAALGLCGGAGIDCGDDSQDGGFTRSH
jgi:hypothetical protein